MAKEALYSVEVTQASIGLHQDNDPLSQPKGTYRFMLNGVNEAVDGQHMFLSNERRNYNCTNLPVGFLIIGDKYIGDDTSALILANPINGKSQIGLINKNDQYTTVVDTSVLGLRVSKQCEVVYRLRRGSEKVIYWVDAYNKARTFNFSREYNFYNQQYQNYLRAGGNPNTYALEKWDAASFDLLKGYSSIPFFSNVEIIETGACLPGSYNFALQYVDEDLNPTEWVTTSNTVNIYNDSVNNPFHKIRGSRNIDTSSQSWQRANKSIKLTMTNLDSSFPYYRIAIIRAAGNTGEPEKVLLSDLSPTSESNFLYSGNDSALASGSLEEILIDQEVIFAPQHIEQLENRLLLANTKGKSINWCGFQQYASKISSDLALKDVILNNIASDPNIKNAKSTFFFRGYMPGEAYSFGIVYLFNDGTLSPVFHIPGKSNADLISKMKVYELTTKYLDIHNCSTNNYWGKDTQGNSLVAKNTRHHRFPFRKDVNEPLFTRQASEVDIQKYKLEMVITLKTGKTYPQESGEPAVLDYTINYKVTGNPTVLQYNGQLVDSDLGSTITIYDDSITLDDITVGAKGQLDPASELATFQTPGDETFNIVFSYIPYVASSSINNDLSKIFGIQFSNIEKPHPDVVGFYIVRNERTDDDKLIVDNSIFGSMTEFQQYKSFGIINPKQFYPVNNCGSAGVSSKTLQYFDNGTWFFSPDFEYFNKKTEFNRVEIEGVYSEKDMFMPVISNTEGSPCNGSGKSKGIYIDDVQVGTSYNPDVNKRKDKDDDGFDLIAGYRTITMDYNSASNIVLPLKKRVLYLSAASYQNFESNTYYNVSVDNKIAMYLTDDNIDTELFYNSTTKKSSLLYGSLVRDITTAYSNYITRPYYKEHNNPVLFGNSTIVNNFQVFNGDAQISSMDFVSSVFYDMVVADRPKKNKLWKIIVGAVLIVAAIVVSVVTLGAGTPAAVAVTASALSALAISYGVSLAVSGIKFEQFKSMVDVDYEKGLKDTVVDGGVFETVRDTIARDDDTIRWFVDRVQSIYIESSIPFGLRSGLTCGVPDFIDSPAPYDEDGFRSYIIEKLTVIDRDQGSGRLYKGYATAELYDMNLDYMRFNKQKIFIHLPIEYDCCADNNEIFPTRIWYSQQSFQEEKIDNYRAFLPNNYRDIEGEHGEITDLYRLGNALFIHTKEGLWQLPQNVQERVTNEIVSFIGTGDFFNIPPRKVIDSTNGSGGTQHKWATIKTPNGVMFVDETEHKVFLHGENLSDVANKGLRDWFKENLRANLTKQLYDKFGLEYPYNNNPANLNGVGYHSNYDTRYERVLITKKDYSILSEKLAQLQLVATKPVAGTAFVYTADLGEFYQGTTQIMLNNTDYFENRSWTISYSFHTNTWVSYHSYLPNYYIRGKNNFYSFDANSNKIWKHNQEGGYQTFYDVYHPFIIEFVKTSTPLLDSITEDFTIQTLARKWIATTGQFVDERFVTFNKMTAYNRYQSTGEVILVAKDTQADANDWLEHQVQNIAGSVLINKVEGNWNVNDIRDNVVDYEIPLFTSDWLSIKNQYFIDKVANLAAIGFNKSWDQLQSLRDKYMVVRLKFDNFDNTNLILNFSLVTEQPSIR
jgi:hypothetical protein